VGTGVGTGVGIGVGGGVTQSIETGILASSSPVSSFLKTSSHDSEKLRKNVVKVTSKVAVPLAGTFLLTTGTGLT
jgi:hypothetical protein